MTTYSRAREEYLETEVLTAGPVRRVQMLYEATLAAVTKAKEAQAAGDIAGRARMVNRATAILTELAISLDHEKGGGLSRQLVELYDYSIRRLLEGSMKKQVGPFAEVERLLGTLLEAWKAVPEIDDFSGARFLSSEMSADDAAGDGGSAGLVAAGVDHLG